MITNNKISVDINNEDSVKEVLEYWLTNFDEMVKQLRNTDGFTYGYEENGGFRPYGEPVSVVHNREIDDTETVEEASERHFFGEVITKYPELIPLVLKFIDKIIERNKKKRGRDLEYGPGVPLGVNAAISLIYFDPEEHIDTYISLQSSYIPDHQLYREHEILEAVDYLVEEEKTDLAIKLFAAYCIPLANEATEDTIIGYGEDISPDCLGSKLIYMLLEDKSPDEDVRNAFLRELLKYAVRQEDGYELIEVLDSILGIEVDQDILDNYLVHINHSGKIPDTIEDFIDSIENFEEGDEDELEDEAEEEN